MFEDGKVAKYIFQMYRDEMRELTFQQGVKADEMKTFARICNEDIAAIDDDSVTLMWAGLIVYNVMPWTLWVSSWMQVPKTTPIY